jgi:hypothetical protein
MNAAASTTSRGSGMKTVIELPADARARDEPAGPPRIRRYPGGADEQGVGQDIWLTAAEYLEAYGHAADLLGEHCGGGQRLARREHWWPSCAPRSRRIG